MSTDRQVYDVQKRARAGTTATLRAVVVLYVLYLGWMILRNYFQGTSTLPPWLAWLAGLGFAAAALGFAVYTYRRYKADLAAAVIRPAPESESE